VRVHLGEAGVRNPTRSDGSGNQQPLGDVDAGISDRAPTLVERLNELFGVDAGALRYEFRYHTERIGKLSLNSENPGHLFGGPELRLSRRRVDVIRRVDLQSCLLYK
jgi:hypothetical protein